MKLRRPLLLVGALLLLVVVFVPGILPVPRRELKVYAAILGDIHTETGQDRVSRVTGVGDRWQGVPSRLGRCFRRRPPGFLTVAAFQAANLHQRRLPERFAVENDLTISAEHDAGVVVARGLVGGVCNGFGERHLLFSRVGFSASGSEALVNVEGHCDGLCGFGAYFLLEKAAGRWHIVDECPLWWS